MTVWRPEYVHHACKSCAIAYKKHMCSVGEKEQRQYGYIEEKAEKSGRYGKRVKGVAIGMVLKQYNAKGHRDGE
jgi:hypothetical protein